MTILKILDSKCVPWWGHFTSEIISKGTICHTQFPLEVHGPPRKDSLPEQSLEKIIKGRLSQIRSS
jgi:hypothetical protein